MKKYLVNIGGMSCTACSGGIERVLKKQKGISDVVVNLSLSQGIIWFDEDIISQEQIDSQIKALGYEINLISDNSLEDKKKKLIKERNRVITALFFMVILLLITMPHMLFKLDLFGLYKNPVLLVIVQLLLALAIMVIGKKFYIKGFKALFNLQPNMDSLVALGTSVAFVYSLYLSYLIIVLKQDHYIHQLYFESAGVIVALVMLGKYFEALSNNRTSLAVDALLELTPQLVNLIDGDGIVVKPIEVIKPDSLVLIKVGEKVPLDGVIVKGNTSVDQSLLTGESLPIEKEVGDEVVGGSLNISGIIEVRVKNDYQNSTVSQMIRLVEEAQLSKAPIARVADIISGYFVFTIIGLSLISGIFWWVYQNDFAFALKIVISVLVIACPCALGLATPTAIMVASGSAAKKGILFKTGEALEKASNINTVVFDKTGTLTKGELKISNIISEWERDYLIQVIASIESKSNHPLAKLFINENKLPLLEIAEVVEIAGQGLKGYYLEKELLVGNRRLLSNITIADEIKETSGFYVAYDGKFVAYLEIADELREESRSVIDKLKSHNYQLYVLSGDSKEVTKKLANELGIEYFAEVLPAGKADKIKELQKEGKQVAFVGDGINDAIALSSANLGVAIGSGSDIALESGDVVLVNSSLNDVWQSLYIGKKCLINVKENLFWAFFYNMLGVPLAMGIFYYFGGWLIDPMFGAFAMSLSSITVVLNALRLRNV